jgi:hypothetical protein
MLTTPTDTALTALELAQAGRFAAIATWLATVPN